VGDPLLVKNILVRKTVRSAQGSVVHKRKPIGFKTGFGKKERKHPGGHKQRYTPIIARQGAYRDKKSIGEIINRWGMRATRGN